MDRELAFINGTVLTMSEEMPTAEGVAVKGSRIVCVGSSSEVRRAVGANADVVDLKGKTTLPGFIDAHTHILSMVGLKSMQIDLTGVRSISQVVMKVADRVKSASKGEWIFGRGWDESKMSERRYITRSDLDEVSPDNPVILFRVDGHLASVNTAALNTAGIGLDMDYVDKDENGQLIGILRDQALSYLPEEIMSPGIEVRKKAIGFAVKEAHRLGVTSVHESASSEDIEAYQGVLMDGNLDLRVYLLNLLGEGGGGGKVLNRLGIFTGFGNEKLKIGALKMFADGSLGARTAYLSEDYSDQPGNRGLIMHTKEELEDMIGRAHKARMQTAVHAIGDMAIQYVLDAYSSCRFHSPKMRNRIEHAELIDDTKIAKAKELGLILSMQPNFVGQWSEPGGMYEDRLGSRFRCNNPFRKIINSGVGVAFGSDCMPFGPLYGIHWAVNHPIPESRITTEEAVKCYTIGGAYASFEEDIKGSIEVGKLADLVVLSDDPLEVESNRIGEIEVIITVMDGKVVYRQL